VGLLAAAALAAGIGAATAIYTVVNTVMLKPLPYRDGGRFVAFFSAAFTDPGHYGTLSLKDLQTFQTRTRSFDAFGPFRYAGKNLMFAGEPHHVQGVAVSRALAVELGVTPAMGQWFADERGVMISSPLWQQLGSDPAIVGKPLTLDGQSFVVSGVMPESFRLPIGGMPLPDFRADVWMPVDPQGRNEPGEGWFAYARRRPGVTLHEAESDLKRVAAEIAAEEPANHPFYTVRVVDLRQTVIEPIRPTLILLFAAAGLLLLITCANAAGLLLGRSVARARETALRVALGAGRARLAATFFMEGLVVSLAGAAGGALISVLVTPAIVSLASAFLPRADEVTIDWRVLLFALGAAVLAGTLASLAPLWQAVRTAPADALGEGVRASAGARSRRLSRALVVAEIALAFALLAASGALVLHLRSVSRVAPGFDVQHLLTFTASVPGTIAAADETRIPFQKRLMDAVAAIPGVDASGFANQVPLDGCCMTTTIYAEGRSDDRAASQRTAYVAASPGFVPALRIPLRHGRLLTERDVAIEGAPINVMVNEAAARRYWGTDNPVGMFGRFNEPNGPRFEIVGVVGDIRNDGLAKPTVPEVYMPGSIARIETMHFVVRSSRPVGSLLPDIRRAVRAVDPEQPVHDAATMLETVERSMTLERLSSLVTAFFALAALVMATLGVYGVTAYGVRQRRVEIGTRMALGATREQVLAYIVGGGLRMAAIGVVIGGAAAIAVSAYLGSTLGIPALGPAPFIYSIGVIGLVASAASFVPAWLASRLSPIVAIRNESASSWRAMAVRARRAVRGLSAAPERPAVPVGALISEFAGAVRGAVSFQDALRDALAALQERIGAQSVLLLDRHGDVFSNETLAIPARGFLASRLKSFPRPLSLTPADVDAWLRWAESLKPGHVAEIEALRGAGIRMAVPLRTRTDVVGILLLGPPREAESYTASDKELVGSSADVLALMIENARLTERTLEQEKLRRDLALAAEVQKRLLPPAPPSTSLGSLAAFSVPARTVGGDYYDFLDLGDARVGIAVADVSGKGIAAALVMSVVQASLRVLSTEGGLRVSDLATKMNAFLHQSTGANKYATFFYAQVDESRRQLRYVNAGHNPPYLVRQVAGQVEITELKEGGTVLGLFPSMAYDEARVDLLPGDLVVAFTDGVTEAVNAADEEFGEDRLKRLLAESVGQTAQEVSTRLAAGVREWMGAAEQHDDVTVVVMVVK
jgi:predicted permease